MLWLAPSSGHLATLREGNYTLMGYRGYKLPANRPGKRIVAQMASWRTLIRRRLTWARASQYHLHQPRIQATEERVCSLKDLSGSVDSDDQGRWIQGFRSVRLKGGSAAKEGHFKAATESHQSSQEKTAGTLQGRHDRCA